MSPVIVDFCATIDSTSANRDCLDCWSIVFLFMLLIQRFHSAFSFANQQEVGAFQLCTSSYPLIMSYHETTVGFIFIPLSPSSFRHHCLLPRSSHGNWYLPMKRESEIGTTQGMWDLNNKRNLKVSLDNSWLPNGFCSIVPSSCDCLYVEYVSFP